MAMFAPATRRKLKLRMAICSPAGYGKSWTATTFAGALAAAFGNGKPLKIAAIDTEHGALSKYAGIINGVQFDVCELQHFAPSAYTAAIREAAAAGYGVLVIDSLSHAWSGVGGALDQVDKKSATGGNSFTAWKDVTPQHNELVEAILAYPGHVIATMRTKMEYVLEEEDRKGRKVMVPKKVGMKPVQREGMDYEFDIVADMDEAHTLIVGKTRCSAIDGQRVVKPGPEFLTPVIRWLDEGIDAPAVTAPVFQATAQATAQNSTIDQIDAFAAQPASDLQVLEIKTSIETLGLQATQPAGMLAKRGVAKLEDLTNQQASDIIATLRAKIREAKADLDKQIVAQDREAAAKRDAKAAAEVKPKPAPVSEAETVVEHPDQIGSILPDTIDRITKAVAKLQFSSDDLRRILAKRQTNSNPPRPVTCLPELSYNQGREMLDRLREAVQKRFPEDDCPF